MDIEKLFNIMANKLDMSASYLDYAANHSQEFLFRSEMNFAELRAHLRELAQLYRLQLAHKALMTHRSFSVKKAAKRRTQPLTEKRRQQLRDAGRKGGRKTGSPVKRMAARLNAMKRWSHGLHEE